MNRSESSIQIDDLLEPGQLQDPVSQVSSVPNLTGILCTQPHNKLLFPYSCLTILSELLIN